MHKATVPKDSCTLTFSEDKNPKDSRHVQKLNSILQASQACFYSLGKTDYAKDGIKQNSEDVCTYFSGSG